MASRLDSRGLLLWTAVTLTTGMMAFFGTGLHPVWWLTWIAPLPVLWLATRASVRGISSCAFTAWAIGGTNMWSYLSRVGVPWTVRLLAVVAPAVIFALAVLLFRWLAERGRWIWAALGFPSTWVVYEFLNAATSPHGTFGSVAYSQMNFLPILQIASLTGIWGVVFCVFLFPAVVAVLLVANNSQTRRSVYGVLALLIAVLSWGVWRLHSMPSGPTVLVGLVASDQPQNVFTQNPEDSLRLLREYAGEAEKLAAQGAQLVIAPEKIGVVPDADIARMDALFSHVSRRTNSIVVAGVVHPTPGPNWNEARIYSNNSVREYEKHHMLPAFESQFTVGTKRILLDEPSGRWGVTICKDMDFPLLSRQYGNDGIGLLVVPAWDFNVDGWLHGRMAILRGIESGFSIARAPKQGILTVTDNRGRVLAEAATSSAPFATVLAHVPVQHDATLYSRWGNWFAWMNVVLFAIAVMSGLLPRTYSQKLR